MTVRYIRRGPTAPPGKPSAPYEGKGFRRKSLHRGNSEHSSKLNRLRYWPIGKWAGGDVAGRQRAALS